MAAADDVNADFSVRVVIDTNAMDWQESPSAGVHRKRLDHTGPAERGRVTSIVRFAAGSLFPEHGHPAGEEVLVLDGVFSDEAGNWGPGAYLFNPEGFRHSPWSDEGCTLFVKLRQGPETDRTHVAMDTTSLPFAETGIDGLTRLALSDDPGHPDASALFRFAPGCRVPHHDHPGGEEGFILEGAVTDEHGRCPAGTWFRSPPGSSHSVWTDEACLIYVKSGHLGGLV